MITEPSVWLPRTMFALERLEVVIERFERREAARLARDTVRLVTLSSDATSHNSMRKD
jgi:hypothetical protein